MANKTLTFIGLIGIICNSCIQFFNHQNDTRLDRTEQAPYTWVVMGPSQAIVRTITQNNQCPSIEIDSISIPMEVRSLPNNEFPITVCEFRLPAHAQKVVLDGRTLAVPSKAPQKILILGDTGCRIAEERDGSISAQNCNNPKDGWPLQMISENAAKLFPDLIIHVGDYIYRDAPCPIDDPRCGGSPHGDTWRTWEEDLFKPVTSLFNAAPWIFLRGNQEACNKRYRGFFSLLYPEEIPSECIDVIDPYWVDLGHIHILVGDSSKIGTKLNLVGVTQKFENSLLATHVPIWDPTTSKKGTQMVPLTDLIEGISLVIAGHRHHFRVSNYSDGRPPQIISGNGGSRLDKDTPKQYRGFESEDRFVLDPIYMEDDYGFAILERINSFEDKRWKLTEYDKNGQPKIVCHTDGKSFKCEK